MVKKDETFIQTERRGQIFIITINRPEARNSFNLEAAIQMNKAIDEFENDPNLFVGILTGAEGIFSSGQDLKAAANGEMAITDERGGFGIFAKPPTKPIIAAVEGYAIAGGFELCLSCDLIVAAKDAKFGLPEVNHNLVAIGGGLFRLPKRMPYHLVMELALMGDMRSAEQFYEYGVINQLVDKGGALEAALGIANKLLENGPTALFATKEIIQRSYEWTEEEAWTKQMPIANKALESEDKDEGLRAFAEKRKPIWKGR